MPLPVHSLIVDILTCTSCVCVCIQRADEHRLQLHLQHVHQRLHHWHEVTVYHDQIILATDTARQFWYQYRYFRRWRELARALRTRNTMYRIRRRLSLRWCLNQWTSRFAAELKHVRTETITRLAARFVQ